MASLQNEKAIETIKKSIFLNLLLSAIKFTSGIFGNSYALIADAIESLADVFGSMLIYFGFIYSKRPADKNHPYGHGKIEPLVTFLIIGILLISATIIIFQSIININTPHKTPSIFTIYILLGIVVWKEISYRWVIKKSKEVNSTTLKAEAWHHRFDAISSIFALIGISIAIIMGKGYEAADDWAAIIAALFIIYNCYSIFKPAFGEIMDEHLYPEVEHKINNISKTIPAILGIEKCYIRKNGMYFQVELHAIINAYLTVKEGHDLAHLLSDSIKEKIPEISYVLVHIEPHLESIEISQKKNEF